MDGGKGVAPLIKRCPICERAVETVLSLPMRDLLGAGSRDYAQQVGICRHCGFIFTQNPFSAEQLSNRYKKESKFEFDSDAYLGEPPVKYRQRAERQKHFIEESLALIDDDFSSMLEVGAAAGYNLSLYPNKRRMGIEPSERNCRSAKKNYGVSMFPGMWQEYKKKQYETIEMGGVKRYDLIFLSMILEHIVDPFQFIEELSSIANKFFFIEVPTLDYKVEEEPYGMMAEEHVNIFTLEGLHSLMAEAGCSLVNAEVYFGFDEYLPAGFPALMTFWRKGGRDAFRTPVLSSQQILENYLSNSKRLLAEVERKIAAIPSEERLAVWGIGHHSAMLLANTSLRDKNIVAAWDSDTRKEGSTFAGIDVKPFSEKQRKDLGVEAILLTTYTAQKAIEKVIQSMDVPMKYYTLYDM